MSAVTERLGGTPPVAGADAPRSGPHPLVVVAAAFALGFVIARVIDWRSHAHPRR